LIDWPALQSANAPLNAFVDWDKDARSGDGPLAGITLGIKSNIAVAGLPWTGGMELYRDRIASKDAEVVTKLRAGGAAILGTLNMHEAALGATTDNAFYGRTHNPHRSGYTPGGSSGGSGAAVAAGLCDAALGTDTLGSVRIPAAYCGVYGLKPTNGFVSNDGLAFLEPSLDVIGPLARSLDMLERIWAVIGEDNPIEAQPVKRLVLLEGLGGVDVQPAVRAAYEKACILLDLPIEHLRLADSLSDIRMAGFRMAGLWLIDHLGAARIDCADQLSDELKFLLKICEDSSVQPDILARTRDTLRGVVDEETIFLMPTAPQTAFAHGRAPANQADFTALANIAGLPALALPAGWSEDGLPVSLQLVGAAANEATLFAVARQLDKALDAYRPPATFGYGKKESAHADHRFVQSETRR
jgi:aspartyl-tRNA(Asn)/glutamyl-tRNA(Gln) amidotransferase subunit A